MGECMLYFFIHLHIYAHRLTLILKNLAVYEQWGLLSLSGIDSLITTPSRIVDPNKDAPAKYKQKLTFEEKKTFFARFLLGKAPKVL